MGVIDLFANNPKKEKEYKVGDWVRIKNSNVDACIVEINQDSFILEWEENGMMKSNSFHKDEIE